MKQKDKFFLRVLKQIRYKVFMLQIMWGIFLTCSWHFEIYHRLIHNRIKVIKCRKRSEMKLGNEQICELTVSSRDYELISSAVKK